MISYLLKLKLRNLFFKSYPSKLNIWRFILLLLTILYGIGISYLIDLFYDTLGDTYGLNFIRIQYLLFYIITLTVNMFPVYRSANWSLLKFPIKNSIKIPAQIFFNLVSPQFIFSLVFGLTLLISKHFNTIEYFSFIVLILNGYLLEKIIFLLLEKKGKPFWSAITATNAILLFFVFTSFWNKSFDLNGVYIILGGMFLSLAGIIYFIANYTNLDKRTIFSQNTNLRFNTRFYYFFLYFFRRKQIRLTLAVSILFKIVLCLSTIKSQEQQYILPINILTCIGIAPVAIFTYVFNNYFGYSREMSLYLNIGKEGNKSFINYLQGLLLPALIDLTISLSLWVYSDIKFKIFLSSYCACLLINMMLGFYSSVKYPIWVTNKLSFSGFKNNSNLGIAFINIFLSVSILNLIAWNFALGISIFISVILVVSIFFISFVNRGDSRQFLFKKLFQNGK